MTTTQLPDNVMERLRTEGATSGWVGDQIGVGPRQAAKILRDLGVHRTHNGWRLNPAPKPRTYGNARACVSSPFTASDFKDGGRE